MIKITQIVLAYFIICQCAVAQELMIQYQQREGVLQYSDPINYKYLDINSDYGMRDYPTSKWHKGIDLNLSKGDDKGNRIISPVHGTITKLNLGTGNYIYMFIQDSHGSRHFGYGHIFNHLSTPQKLGDFVLTKMDDSDQLVIIDLLNCIAFGPEIGEVTYGDAEYISQTYTVTDEVVAGQAIAPIGNSAAQTKPHLHLYLLKDPESRINVDNTKNPLLYIYGANNNPFFSFDVLIDSVKNITKFMPDPTFYSGEASSIIKIKVKLNDEPLGVPGDLYYKNGVLDIEKVSVYIKRFHEQEEKYKLIKGDNWDSQIILGGSLGENRYPSPNNPKHNTFDIITKYGGWTTTGAYPEAYSSGSSDYYYFTDFYTRIHKDDKFNTKQFALINQDARYPDGVYSIKPRAVRIAGADAFNPENPSIDDPISIIIDNFCPYISKVTVEDNEPNQSPKYSREWKWSNNKLKLEPGISERLTSNNGVKIKVFSSEPLKELSVRINNYVSTQNSSRFDKDVWEFCIPKENLNPGLNKIILVGFDVNNNQLQNKPDVIPIRQSNSDWSPLRSPGEDRYHEFMFGAEWPVDFVVQQLGTDYNFLSFYDKSTITGENLWEFGDNQTANGENVNHKYTHSGTYFVNHSVAGMGVSKIVVVQDIVQPFANFIYSIDYTNPYRTIDYLPIDFYSQCEGLIGTYLWEFGNGITSSEENPSDIMLPIQTINTVKLTVTSGPPSDPLISTCQYDIFIDPDVYPYATIFDFEETYFRHLFDIMTDNFDEDYSKTFEINFGDGTDNIVDGYENTITFEHEYFSLGDFLVTIKVTGTDLNGNSVTVTNAKEISVNYDFLKVAISQNPTETPFPLKNISFQSLVVEPVLSNEASFYGCWRVFKKNDPSFYYSENFSGYVSGGFPSIEKSFPSAGDYVITIDIAVGSMSGHDEFAFTIVNAPDYLDAELYGKNKIAINTSYTYTASVYPIGAPGVSELDWVATNIRWTLVKPDGSITPKEKPITIQESRDVLYETFNFNQIGTYKLLFEAWNNQHGYTEGELNPNYINTNSFYDACIKEIEVGDFPALNLIQPLVMEPQAVRADGSESIELQFSNPNLSPISWKIETSYGEDWVVGLPEINSLHTLNSGEVITRQITPLPNTSIKNRHCTIRIRGFDIDNNEVQGSPSHFILAQNGILGPGCSLENGDLEHHLFGFSVSLDGLNALIGAPSTHPDLKGVAYIYQKDSYGEWNRKATLEPSDNNPNFGKTVSLNGDYVIIAGEGSKNAYIYKMPQTGWNGTLNELKKIDGSDFGTGLKDICVSIWGDYAAIGIPYFDRSIIDEKGRVDVFYRNKDGVDNWGRIKSFTGLRGDNFGYSVSLYNDKLVVGAAQNTNGQGYINVYNRNKESEDDWLLVSKITSLNNYESNARFGRRCAVFDNVIGTLYLHKDEWGYLTMPTVMYHTDKMGNIIDMDEANFITGIIEEANTISIYKNLKNEQSFPENRDFYLMFGFPFGCFDKSSETDPCPNMGITGYAEYSNWNGWYSLKNRWQLNDFFTPEDNDYYGYSVSISHAGNLIGIPGYLREGAYGTVQFDNYKCLNSKYDARISLELINFIKPVGNYSDVEAYDLVLGGRSFPAQIQPGARINYRGNSITLKEGFVAERGSNWTAEPIDPTDSMNSSDNESTQLVQSYKLNLLNQIQKEHKTFPWHLYEPEIILQKIDLDKVNSDHNLDSLIPVQLRKLFTILISETDEKANN